MPTASPPSAALSNTPPRQSNGSRVSRPVAGSSRQAATEQHRCDRQVDDEQPVPAIAEQDAPQHRADQERQAEHRADQPECAAALVFRERIADNRRRDREDAAGAQALYRATGQQHLEVAGQHDQQRARGESEHAADVDVTPAEAVGHLGEQRRPDQLRQDIDVEQPRQLTVVESELRLHRRQRRTDDREVQRPHQNADEQQRHHGLQIRLLHRHACTRVQMPTAMKPTPAAYDR